MKNLQAAGNLIAENEHVYDSLENNPKIDAYSRRYILKSRGYRKAEVPHYDYVIIFRIDEVTIRINFKVSRLSVSITG